MIVDCVHDIKRILQDLQSQLALVIPILSNPNRHPTQNPITAIYVYLQSDEEYIIPIRHTEQITGFTEHVHDVLRLTNIFVYDKKQWLQIGGNEAVWDVKSLWWYTYNEAYNESYYPTPAHQFFWRRHESLAHVNALIPLQKHLEMCQKIRHYAWPMCINSKLTDSYLRFNATYPAVFAEIESAGLSVNSEFRMPELVSNGKVYTQYNYFTATGRPSNAYRGFNFAAMNKEDGTRSAFCSRFESGALVEMDFDSYHVRLIARLIEYTLPTTSVHDYLGQFYFDTTILTETQRVESKAITFRLLYGGIDREFLSIPFFKKVNEFIYELWSQWKTKRYIETPIFKRQLTADALKNMTANKLFNYFLQAVETEVSVQKLRVVLDLLKSYDSKLILYTYDSLLLDIKYSEAKTLLPQIKLAAERGNFPVKIKAGGIYDKMNQITL